LITALKTAFEASGEFQVLSLMEKMKMHYSTELEMLISCFFLTLAAMAIKHV
jgi:hypothetical protein